MNEEQIIQMIETLKQIGFDEVQATILTQLIGEQEVRRLERVYWDQLIEKISQTLEEI